MNSFENPHPLEEENNANTSLCSAHDARWHQMTMDRYLLFCLNTFVQHIHNVYAPSDNKYLSKQGAALQREHLKEESFEGTSLSNDLLQQLSTHWQGSSIVCDCWKCALVSR